jgi:hypothetical protein
MLAGIADCGLDGGVRLLHPFLAIGPLGTPELIILALLIGGFLVGIAVVVAVVVWSVNKSKSRPKQPPIYPPDQQ